MTPLPRTPLAGARPVDLRWLAGSWLGRNGADAVEEDWSLPGGDTLVGMFRWVRDGRVRFYELIAIEHDGGRVLTRIEHFDPGLVGWEEAYFLEVAGSADPRWAVYRREGADRLVSYFVREDGSGTNAGLFESARVSGAER